MKNRIFIYVLMAGLLISMTAVAQTRSVMFANSQFGKWIVTSSSTLSPQTGNRYVPGNAVDDNNSTAWVEGASGDGIGEAIMITFEQPTRIGTIYIKNGYGKNSGVFAKNNRVKDANIQMEGGMFKIKLKDAMGEQTIKVPAYQKDAKNKKTRTTYKVKRVFYIKFSVLS